jgi:copper resistance protein D
MLTALLIVARTVQIGASLLFAGIFIFEAVVLGTTGPPADDDQCKLDRRLFGVALCALGAAFFSAVLWFWLVVASMGGLSLARAFSADAWRMVLFETDFGRVWQLRLGLIAAAFALVIFGRAQKKLHNSLKLVVCPLSLVLLISLAWISHAAAASPQPLGLLGDAFHLCAAAGWMGGLFPLAIFVSRVDDSVSLGARAPSVLRRFSALSLGCVSVLVLSGLANSWLLVGSLGALFTTPYGLLLLFKLTLFAILLGLGARNRLMIRTAPWPTAARSDLLPQLRRNITSEVCLGLAVVAIVGWLGITPPARHGDAPRVASGEAMVCEVGATNLITNREEFHG